MKGTRVSGMASRPVVLFVSHTSAWGGGAEIVLRQLARAARRAGYSPRLVCPPGELVDRAGEYFDRVTPITVPALSRTRNPLRVLSMLGAWLAASARLAVEIRRSGAAVVHASTGVAALSACVPAAVARRPLVWHQFEIVPDRRVNRTVFGLCGRLSSAVAVCSQVVRRSLMQLGVPGERIHVVYNCVREEFLTPPPAREAARAAAGLRREGAISTVIGRLVPIKGQKVFLEALALLADQGLDVHGVVLGDPTFGGDGAMQYVDDLHRLAGLPALRGRITFLEHRDDVRTVVAASDVIVMPSHPDAFPLVNLEAFATGVPVVGANTGGHPESIEEGVTGLMAPPGDAPAFAVAIRRLLEDDGLREAIIRQAAERVRSEFSEEQLPGRLHELYSPLIAPVNGAAPAVDAFPTREALS